MTLNDTPSSQRTHIGFFGCRNAGKSSLVNAVTGQALSIVSDEKGTTTDPVYKSMELLPLGPVVIIDTPGFDDEGTLGQLRIQRTKDTLNRSDIAVLVVDASVGIQPADLELLSMIREKQLPCMIVFNKCDLTDDVQTADNLPAEPSICVSAKTGQGIHECKEMMARMMPRAEKKQLAADLVQPLDFAVLVCPIDESAPAGRLILPQQQTIRDLLDRGAIPVVCKETELAETLRGLKKDPAIVITDSQAFAVVSKIVPESIPLTSFSILMARYKGFLETAIHGVGAIHTLKDGDRVLLAEGCTHHRQCNDIGAVKIPNWLRAYTGKNLEIVHCSGRDFPEDLTPFSLVIHCGGCMLTEQVIRYRMQTAVSQGVPFTNYGIIIAQMTGALPRSILMFDGLQLP